MGLRWTELAVQDLTDICDYVAQNQSAAAARRIATRLCSRIEILEQFPTLGRPGRIPGTREFIFSGLPWITVYSIRDDQIVIRRILHGARRFPQAP